MKNISAMLKRRELLKYLVISKVKQGGANMILGYLWWILDPLILMLIYWFMVGVIFQRGGEEYPLFILCGLVPFRALAISLGQSVNSIASKASIISQINFPRSFLPISDVLANYFKLMFGFLVVLVLATQYGRTPGLHTLFLIIPFLIQCFLSLGIGLLISILGVYIPDVRNMVQFIVRLWLYTSPVLYSVERIPDFLREYFMLNPMASIILMYREIVMFERLPSIELVYIAGAEAILLLTIGWLVFMSNQSKVLKAL